MSRNSRISLLRETEGAGVLAQRERSFRSWDAVIPDITPRSLRLFLWLALALWMMWVGMSLIHDDTTATALTVENGFLQQVTVLCYVVAGIVFVRLAIRYFRDPFQALYRRWLFVLALASVFIAGEEINWGQVYFHFGTPSPLERANLQQEISLHNLRLPGPFSEIYWSHVVLWGMALWGGVMFPLLLTFSRTFRKWVAVLRFPIPPRLTIACCFAAAVIPLDNLLLGHFSRDNIPSELREVTIAFAVAIWAWSLWQRQPVNSAEP